jgi:hypothetical protein
MRKDLLSMQKALKQIKNPNFPEYKAQASTTDVNVGPANLIGNTNIANVGKEKADIKSQTFKPSQMKKDLIKGVSMLFGYYDKPAPPTGS